MAICRNCGKTLKKEALDGLGPECIKKLGKANNDSKKYQYARESEFSNLGEDIKHSARHNHHQWRGILEAELEGEEVAVNVVTRDKLLKNSPVDIKINEGNIIASTIAITMIKRMPAAPEYIKDGTPDTIHYALCKKGSKDNNIIILVSEREHYLLGLSEKRYPGTFVLELGEVKNANKIIRQAYFEKYEWVKEAAGGFSENKALESVHTIEDESKMASIINGEVKKLSEKYKSEFGIKVSENYIVNSEADCAFLGRYMATGRRPKKFSIGDSVNTTLAGIKKEGITVSLERIKKANDGGAIGIGTPSIKIGRFNPIVFYNQEIKRIGPEIPFKNKVEMESFLSPDGSSKTRGLQWGQAVSEKERLEHLTQLCGALTDLKDSLGLEFKELSLDGKLALAVGARGKASAMAHYEQKEKAINLTRKNGIGALAHEYGHALENILYDKKEKGGFSDSLGAIPKDTEGGFKLSKDYNTRNNKDSDFLDVQKPFTVVMKKFYDRMKESETFKEMPFNHKKYLAEPAEMFARTFEAMVQMKLDKKGGRINTYLVSCSNVDCYPNRGELEEMEPHFDGILRKLFGR
jgi:hypothetical protein